MLPAYDEGAVIERVVRETAHTARRVVGDPELIVVDDGSTDDTPQVLGRLAAELGERLVVVRHPTNRGYGAALRSGFAAARGTRVFYTDSDGQFDIGELADALPLLERVDAVLGYRVDRQDPRLRLVVSAFFNWLTCVAFGLDVRDINCSFKLFDRDILARLPLEANDFFIDAELIIQLRRGGWRYAQLGVRHLPRAGGHSKVRPGDIPRTLSAIARTWLRLRRAGLPATGRRSAPPAL